ncbi:MAG: ABC transporter permease [Vagococcus sp.]|uniref:ABC transporter permease n=1 Tax=Vagococcus sp. TaxID=1933889 RepID=UPI002FCC7819
MNKFWVVALETYKKHVKSVSFVTMVLGPILMLGLIFGINIMAAKFAHTNEIAVVSESVEVSSAFMEQTKKDFDFNKKIKTEDEAKKELEKENIDGYLVISDKEMSLDGKYFGEKALGTESMMIMQQALSQIQMGMNSTKLNLSQKEVGALLVPATFSEQQVEFVDGKMQENKNNKGLMTIVGMVVLMAVYTIVLTYSTITAQEVASEKGTRIMEVILSSTTAAKHFYGKVTGIALVILTQVSIYLVSGVLGYFFIKDMSVVKDFLSKNSLTELLKGLLGYNMLYLLFGVLIFTILSAFTGSLVSKVEDATKAVTPVMYVVMAGFIPSFSLGMANPQSVVLKVMSFVPFLSSFAMPLRIASNEATNSEILISLGLLVVAIGVLLKLSAKAYKSTVLIYSDKSMMSVFKDAMKFSK